MGIALLDPKHTETNTGIGRITIKRTGTGRLSKTISDFVDDKDATLALKLSNIETATKNFLFTSPILFQIVNEGNGVIIENEQLDLFAAGKTQEEAKRELFSQFEYSYKLFNELKDEQLGSHLLKVKKYYNLIVKETIEK